MKKLFLFATAAMIMASCSSDKGKVTIQLPKDFNEKTLVVSHVTIDNAYNAKQAEEIKVIYDTLEVNNGIATLTLDPAGAARYNIESPVVTLTQPEFYASPEDNLEVTIENFDPLAYQVRGSELMDDLTRMRAVTDPIKQEYFTLVSRNEIVTEAEAKASIDRYDNAIKKFVADNPKSQAVPLAILELSSDDFKQIYDNMTPEAKKSIVMPYAMQYNSEVEKVLKERDAEQARKDEIASGTITAPDFTLPDLNGKKVSLSDFKGKWVVLDFWGSWCGWCIKGFPALKDAYKQYGDKITIIGIDCNDMDSDWRAAVKKYELPWLQLYNGNNTDLYSSYNIEGFPTKAIINPEGKLVDLTTGEDPSFFTRLADFVK
ncbi:MAG: TlpA family protein disulfide reductase [Muribaculaceae bacterium]|nr:TlpA family protein disulfide reductase [Muribaculaceae bacterium]